MKHTDSLASDSQRPSEVPVTSDVRRVLRRRALVEAHDVYVPNEAQTIALMDECTALYRELRFDEGIERARRDEQWEHDPTARLYVAIGLHYQRRYEDARAEYLLAMNASDTRSFRATCLANVGTTWFEQGDFTRALDAYERALTVEPGNEFGLLGCVAVACEQRDADSVVTTVGRLRERWPGWRNRPVITAMVMKDRSFRFVRETEGLFEQAFGVRLNAVVDLPA